MTEGGGVIRRVPEGGQRLPELHVVLADIAVQGGVSQGTAGAALLRAMVTMAPPLGRTAHIVRPPSSCDGQGQQDSFNIHHNV